MAQTRGQSRTLAAPLRFIVKLAGYATTPAEEADADSGDGGASPGSPDLEGQLAEAVAQRDALQERAGAVLDLSGQQTAAEALEAVWPNLDAVEFLTKLEKRFGGYVPETAGAALRAWAWFAARSAAQEQETPQSGPQRATGSETPQEPETESEGETR